MTLVIHVGFHKTGSTAIQSFLSRKRNELAEQGVEVPPGLSSWLGHPEIAWACNGGVEPWQDRRYDLAEIEAHYRPYLESSFASDKIVLLTSEEFSRYEYCIEPMRRLKNFLGAYDPVIIGYTRDPFDFLLSRFRHETQEGRETRTLPQFLTNDLNLASASFWQRTAIWEELFHQRCIWRNYSNIAKNNKYIVSNFMGLLGLDITNEGVYEDDEIKLHPVFLLALRTIWQAQLTPHEEEFLVSTLFSLGNRMPNLGMRGVIDYLGVTPELEAQIRNLLSCDRINMTRVLSSMSGGGTVEPNQADG